MQAKGKLLKVVKKIVEERKIAMERSDEKGNIEDVVDLLLREYGEANEMQSLPLDFISDNIIEMMIPGEETVPTAMTLAVKFLSDCPVALKQMTVSCPYITRYSFFASFDPTTRIILKNDTVDVRFMTHGEVFDFY